MSGLPDVRRLFATLDTSSRPTIVAAVSGGGDSVALLTLLSDWQRDGAPVRLLAVTIDHGLRPESAAEAETVARLSASLGIAHRTLRWTHDGAPRGLMAAARLARYRLLAQAAAEADSDLVLTAHTLDDQAETVAMRSARAPGGEGAGLAGIAPATLHEGTVWFARPLLGLRRNALRAMLQAKQIEWVDDPSNDAQRFERARIRATLGETDIGALAGRGAEAAHRRTALAERAAGLAEALADCPMPGLVRLSSAWRGVEDRAALSLLLRALAAVSAGTQHLPSDAEAQSALDSLEAGQEAISLSRAVIERRAGGLVLRRALRGLPAPEQLASGMIWDGRFRMVSDAAALVRAGAPSLDGEPPAGLTPRLVREVSATLPVADGGARFEPVLGPWQALLPCFDLALARAIAQCVGATMPPPAPFAGHKARAGFATA